MATLKELKEYYPYVLKNKGKYIVYTEGGLRSPYKYVATVNKKGNSMFVDNYPPTTKMSVLNEQIEDFQSNLLYDSEYYNPMFREGVFEELIIIDYLDSISFVHKGDDNFEYVDKSIYGYQTTSIHLTIQGLNAFNKLEETVRLMLHTGDYSWITLTVKRNVEDIKKGIDTLLKPLLLSESAKNIINSDKMEEDMSMDVLLKLSFKIWIL